MTTTFDPVTRKLQLRGELVRKEGRVAMESWVNDLADQDKTLLRQMMGESIAYYAGMAQNTVPCVGHLLVLAKPEAAHIPSIAPEVVLFRPCAIHEENRFATLALRAFATLEGLALPWIQHEDSFYIEDPAVVAKLKPYLEPRVAQPTEEKAAKWVGRHISRPSASDSPYIQ